MITTLVIERDAYMNQSTDNTLSPDKSGAPAQARRAKIAPVDSADLRFQLTNVLHSTLDLRSTLSYFFEYADQLVNCIGIRYENPKKNISLSFGDRGKHSAQYSVSSEEDNLGTLQFLRNRKFAETELAFIEMLIGVLFHPLRNALQYKDALECSMLDTLTGLKNRLALDMYADREIKLAQRHQKAMSVLIIDLDHFKDINDTHGHLGGDAALKHCADAMLQAVRETDQVFRYGGEEFVILLNEADLDNALKSAERIRKKIAALSIPFNDKTISLTTSVGVSAVTPKDTFHSIFARADEALYLAKSSGRDQVVCSESDRNEQIRKIA